MNNLTITPNLIYSQFHFTNDASINRPLLKSIKSLSFCSCRAAKAIKCTALASINMPISIGDDLVNLGIVLKKINIKNKNNEIQEALVTHKKTQNGGIYFLIRTDKQKINLIKNRNDLIAVTLDEIKILNKDKNFKNVVLTQIRYQLKDDGQYPENSTKPYYYFDKTINFAEDDFIGLPRLLYKHADIENDTNGRIMLNASSRISCKDKNPYFLYYKGGYRPINYTHEYILNVYKNNQSRFNSNEFRIKMYLPSKN